MSSSVASAAEEAKTFRLTLPASAHEAIRHITREFKWEMEKRSAGSVKIELNDVSTYKDNDIIAAVAAGSIEIGGTTLDQFANEAPLAGIFLQPFMFNFSALIRAAAKPGGEIRALVDANILEKTKTRVLWWQPNGSNVIFAKGVPAEGASIANLSVGTPDDRSKELIEACGGKPEPVPTSDLYSAFREGKIKAAATDILGVTTNNLWDAADTIMNTQHTPSLYLFAVNDRAWQSLSPEQQKTMSAVAREIQDKTWDRYLATEAVAYSLAEQRGMDVYELSRHDSEEWRACSSPLLEAYMERTGGAGQQLFAAYGKLRTDPCCRDAPDHSSAGDR
jgi:C4-dicarboxylate-binding protein DctP